MPVAVACLCAKHLTRLLQVVQQGTSFMNDGGSFTLMSGLLARDPIVAGCVASMVNGAIESFVISAAIDLCDEPAHPVMAAFNPPADLAASESTLLRRPFLSSRWPTTPISQASSKFLCVTWCKRT